MSFERVMHQTEKMLRQAQGQVSTVVADLLVGTGLGRPDARTLLEASEDPLAAATDALVVGRVDA